MSKIRVSVFLTEKQLERLKQLKELTDVDVSENIRQALEPYLKDQEAELVEQAKTDQVLELLKQKKADKDKEPEK